MGSIAHQCCTDSVDSIGGGHPFGGDEVGEVNVDIEERFVEQMAGSLTSQLLKGRQQNLELGRSFLKMISHNDLMKLVT